MTAEPILTNDNRSPAKEVAGLLGCLLGVQILFLRRAEKAREEAQGLPGGEELAVLTERAQILEEAASAICGVARIAKEVAEDLAKAESTPSEQSPCGLCGGLRIADGGDGEMVACPICMKARQ